MPRALARHVDSTALAVAMIHDIVELEKRIELGLDRMPDGRSTRILALARDPIIEMHKPWMFCEEAMEFFKISECMVPNCLKCQNYEGGNEVRTWSKPWAKMYDSLRAKDASTSSDIIEYLTIHVHAENDFRFVTIDECRLRHFVEWETVCLRPESLISACKGFRVVPDAGLLCPPGRCCWTNIKWSGSFPDPSGPPRILLNPTHMLQIPNMPPSPIDDSGDEDDEESAESECRVEDDDTDPEINDKHPSAKRRRNMV